MTTINVENVKLLDGMHEGLLILSKTDCKAMFMNKTAQKLINTFLNTLSKQVDEKALKKRIFERVSQLGGKVTINARIADGSSNDAIRECLSLD